MKTTQSPAHSRTGSTKRAPFRAKTARPRASATTALAVAACAALASCSTPNPDSPSAQSANPSQAVDGATTNGIASQPGGAGANGSQCATDALELSTSGANSGAGSTFYTLVFKNSGDLPCTLDGFPGVSLVSNNNGTQLGRSADREESIAHQPVTIEPGRTATAEVRVGSTGPLDPHACAPAPADGFRVYPPGETRAGYVPVKGLTGCSGDLPLLSVRPVVAPPQ